MNTKKSEAREKKEKSSGQEKKNFSTRVWSPLMQRGVKRQLETYGRF